MPALMQESGPEYDSEEERRDRKKTRHRSKSRSRSRDRKKSKKHKKEKKHRRRRSESAGDTEGEGAGDTPGRQQKQDTPPLSSANNIPGLTRYESDDGEDMDDKLEETRREKYDREKDRDREKRGERKKKKRSRSRSRSRSRHRRSRSKERRKEDKNKRSEYRREEGEIEGGDIDLTEGGGKKVISLSIEETNNLRAKLGLKPLNIVDTSKPAEQEEDVDESVEGTLIPGDRDKTRHLPPTHIGEKKKSEQLREKLSVRKERRTVQSRLAAVKGLADSDSDDDAETWIQKQKSTVEAKKEADKRAKMMSELDDEFGVADIVKEKIAQDRGKSYSSRDLKGLRVEHSTEHFGDGETVLTLKDQDILDDKYEDVLVNVNIMDTERTKKNFENIKSQAGYQAYDNEIVDDLTGQVKKKDLLYQYTEEIDGHKKDSFTLANSGEFNAEEDKARELAKIRQKLKLGAAQTLAMPELKLASDYYSTEEMAAFKKPKAKKKKIRKKMLKADDLLAMQTPESLLPADFGNKPKKKRAARIIDDDEEMNSGGPNYDDLPVVEDLSGVKVDDEDVLAVRKRLQKAKKLKSAIKAAQAITSLDRVADDIIAQRDANDVEMGGNAREYDDLILDQTQEFCRGLGENAAYESSGLVEGVHEDLLDFERSLTGSRKEKSENKVVKIKTGGWEAVGADNTEDNMDIDMDDDDENNTNKKANRPAILDDELLVGTGMAAALKAASQMGYIEKSQTKAKSSGLQELVAKKFSIEDKSRDYEEDDRKRRGRDRGGYSGPTTSFAEKKGYKPEVNLEYLDDGGRAMNRKEAFRHLSHKFHGKGSGKIKTEKRQRKIAEEKVMERMSSVDTPLQTLHKQQERLKDLATPYLVLTGNKQLNSLKK